MNWFLLLLILKLFTTNWSAPIDQREIQSELELNKQNLDNLINQGFSVADHVSDVFGGSQDLNNQADPSLRDTFNENVQKIEQDLQNFKNEVQKEFQPKPETNASKEEDEEEEVVAQVVPLNVFEGFSTSTSQNPLEILGHPVRKDLQDFSHSTSDIASQADIQLKSHLDNISSAITPEVEPVAIDKVSEDLKSDLAQDLENKTSELGNKAGEQSEKLIENLSDKVIELIPKENPESAITVKQPIIQQVSDSFKNFGNFFISAVHETNPTSSEHSIENVDSSSISSTTESEDSSNSSHVTTSSETPASSQTTTEQPIIQQVSDSFRNFGNSFISAVHEAIPTSSSIPNEIFSEQSLQNTHSSSVSSSTESEDSSNSSHVSTYIKTPASSQITTEQPIIQQVSDSFRNFGNSFISAVHEAIPTSYEQSTQNVDSSSVSSSTESEVSSNISQVETSSETPNISQTTNEQPIIQQVSDSFRNFGNSFISTVNEAIPTTSSVSSKVFSEQSLQNVDSSPVSANTESEVSSSVSASTESEVSSNASQVETSSETPAIGLTIDSFLNQVSDFRNNLGNAANDLLANASINQIASENSSHSDLIQVGTSAEHSEPISETTGEALSNHYKEEGSDETSGFKQSVDSFIGQISDIGSNLESLDKELVSDSVMTTIDNSSKSDQTNNFHQDQSNSHQKESSTKTLAFEKTVDTFVNQIADIGSGLGNPAKEFIVEPTTNQIPKENSSEPDNAILSNKKEDISEQGHNFKQSVDTFIKDVEDVGSKLGLNKEVSINEQPAETSRSFGENINSETFPASEPKTENSSIVNIEQSLESVLEEGDVKELANKAKEFASTTTNYIENINENPQKVQDAIREVELIIGAASDLSSSWGKSFSGIFKANENETERTSEKPNELEKQINTSENLSRSEESLNGVTSDFSSDMGQTVSSWFNTRENEEEAGTEKTIEQQIETTTPENVSRSVETLIGEVKDFSQNLGKTVSEIFSTNENETETATESAIEENSETTNPESVSRSVETLIEAASDLSTSYGKTVLDLFKATESETESATERPIEQQIETTTSENPIRYVETLIGEASDFSTNLGKTVSGLFNANEGETEPATEKPTEQQIETTTPENAFRSVETLIDQASGFSTNLGKTISGLFNANENETESATEKPIEQQLEITTPENSTRSVETLIGEASDFSTNLGKTLSDHFNRNESDTEAATEIPTGQQIETTTPENALRSVENLIGEASEISSSKTVSNFFNRNESETQAATEIPTELQIETTTPENAIRPLETLIGEASDFSTNLGKTVSDYFNVNEKVTEAVTEKLTENQEETTSSENSILSVETLIGEASNLSTHLADLFNGNDSDTEAVTEVPIEQQMETTTPGNAFRPVVNLIGEASDFSTILGKTASDLFETNTNDTKEATETSIEQGMEATTSENAVRSVSSFIVEASDFNRNEHNSEAATERPIEQLIETTTPENAIRLVESLFGAASDYDLDQTVSTLFKADENRTEPPTEIIIEQQLATNTSTEGQVNLSSQTESSFRPILELEQTLGNFAEKVEEISESLKEIKSDSKEEEGTKETITTIPTYIESRNRKTEEIQANVIEAVSETGANSSGSNIFSIKEITSTSNLNDSTKEINEKVDSIESTKREEVINNFEVYSIQNPVVSYSEVETKSFIGNHETGSIERNEMKDSQASFEVSSTQTPVESFQEYESKSSMIDQEIRSGEPIKTEGTQATSEVSITQTSVESFQEDKSKSLTKDDESNDVSSTTSIPNGIAKTSTDNSVKILAKLGNDNVKEENRYVFLYSEPNKTEEVKTDFENSSFQASLESLQKDESKSSAEDFENFKVLSTTSIPDGSIQTSIDGIIKILDVSPEAKEVVKETGNSDVEENKNVIKSVNESNERQVEPIIAVEVTKEGEDKNMFKVSSTESPVEILQVNESKDFTKTNENTEVTSATSVPEGSHQLFIGSISNISAQSQETKEIKEKVTGNVEIEENRDVLKTLEAQFAGNAKYILDENAESVVRTKTAESEFNKENPIQLIENILNEKSEQFINSLQGENTTVEIRKSELDDATTQEVHSSLNSGTQQEVQEEPIIKLEYYTTTPPLSTESTTINAEAVLQEAKHALNGIEHSLNIILEQEKLKQKEQTSHHENSTSAPSPIEITALPKEDFTPTTSMPAEDNTMMPKKFEEELQMAVKALEETTHHHFEEFQNSLKEVFKKFSLKEREEIATNKTSDKEVKTETGTTEFNMLGEATTLKPEETEVKTTMKPEEVEVITTMKPEDVEAQTHQPLKEESTTMKTEEKSNLESLKKVSQLNEAYLTEEHSRNGLITTQFIDKFADNFEENSEAANSELSEKKEELSLESTRAEDATENSEATNSELTEKKEELSLESKTAEETTDVPMVLTTQSPIVEEISVIKTAEELKLTPQESFVEATTVESVIQEAVAPTAENIVKLAEEDMELSQISKRMEESTEAPTVLTTHLPIVDQISTVKKEEEVELRPRDSIVEASTTEGLIQETLTSTAEDIVKLTEENVEHSQTFKKAEETTETDIVVSTQPPNAEENSEVTHSELIEQKQELSQVSGKAEETTETPIILTTQQTIEEEIAIEQKVKEVELRPHESFVEATTLESVSLEAMAPIAENIVKENIEEVGQTTTEDFAEITTTPPPQFARVPLQKDINNIYLVARKEFGSQAPVTNYEQKDIMPEAHNDSFQFSATTESKAEAITTTYEPTPETTQQEMVTFIERTDTTTDSEIQRQKQFNTEESIEALTTSQTQEPLTQASFMEEQQQQIESTTEHEAQTQTDANARADTVTTITAKHADDSVTEQQTTTETEIVSTTKVGETDEDEALTTISSVEASVGEPEPRSLKLTPPKLEYLQNEDGVEVFYGYSTVKRN